MFIVWNLEPITDEDMFETYKASPRDGYCKMKHVFLGGTSNLLLSNFYVALDRGGSKTAIFGTE